MGKLRTTLTLAILASSASLVACGGADIGQAVRQSQPVQNTDAPTVQGQQAYGDTYTMRPPDPQTSPSRSQKEVDDYFTSHYGVYAKYPRTVQFGMLTTPNQRDANGRLAIDRRPAWVVVMDNVPVIPNGPAGSDLPPVNCRVSVFLADGSLSFLSEFSESMEAVAARSGTAPS